MLGSCSDEGLQITGTVYSFNYVGLTCWYIVDQDSGFYYELVTNDEFLCRKGLKVRIRANRSEADTICNVGDRIDVLSYQVLKDLPKPKEDAF